MFSTNNLVGSIIRAYPSKTSVINQDTLRKLVVTLTSNVARDF
jgi:hypothetical protein